MTTENIEFDVAVDIAAYSKALAKIPGITDKEAKKASEKFVEQIKKGQIKAALEAEKAAKSAGKSWEDEMEAASKGIAAGFGAVFGAVAAGFAVAAEINEARTEMINLSDATGIALDTLAGLEAAASRAGVPTSEVIDSFEDFGEVLFDFSQGGGRAEEALKLLGFEAADMDDAMDDVDGTLRRVIKDMTAMKDGAQKSAVAQQLFGDAGNRLNAILGDDALEDYIDLAEAYGTVIDEDAVKATEDWNEAIADLGGVIKGTTTDLVDFFIGADAIKGTTALFIFSTEILKGIVKEYVENVGLLTGSFEKLTSGDILGFMSDFVDGTFLGVEEAKALVHQAALAVTAFDAEASALKKGKKEKEGNTRATGKLSDAEKGAAKATNEAAKARADAARASEQEFQSIVTAQQQLSGISRAALQDQRTGIELVNLALVDQLMAIDEIEETLGASSATQLARDQVRERAARDIQQLQLEQIDELQIAFDESIDHELQRRAEVREQIRSSIDVALEGFAHLSSAANAFLDLRLGQLATEAAAERGFLDDQTAMRQEVQEQIGTAANDAERDRLVQNARQLAAEEETSEQILAIKQRESNRLFAARKGIEIATILASGASAAIAALSPPPVGAGPIGGPFLAGTIAAAVAGQVALVGAQKAPQFDAGFPGFTKGPDNFPAILREGEAVLNQAATDSLGGPSAVNDMNETRAGGGGRSLDVNLTLGTRQVGRAIVDEMGAGRELDRAIQKRTGKRAGVRPVYNNR